MKSQFFPKRDEVVLSTVTALIVMLLVHQGITALMNGRQHAMFQKNIAVLKK